MGRIARLRLITMARIEAFLASLEDPEAVLPELISEMSKMIVETAKAEAKAFSAVKGDRRRVDAAAGRLGRLEKGAELAVRAGEVETARQAVAAQITAERELASCRGTLDVSESAYQSAVQVRRQLQEGLDELKLRGQEIISRLRTVESRDRIRRAVNMTGRDGGGILDAVARMEAGLDEQEAQIEIQDQVSRTLGMTFEHERSRELESADEVEQRLNELRKQMEREGR